MLYNVPLQLISYSIKSPFGNNLFYLLSFDCAGSLLLLRLFSSWGEWASHLGGFSSCGVQAIGTGSSVVVAHGSVVVVPGI